MRVAIAEDSVLLREGLARLLTEAGFEVVAQCGTAEALLLKVRSYAPDVAIVDIRMPLTHHDDGLRVALAIRPQPPSVGVRARAPSGTPETRPRNGQSPVFRRFPVAARLSESPQSPQGAVMKTRIIQNEPDEPAANGQAGPTPGESRGSRNLAAQMGRWSASH